MNYYAIHNYHNNRPYYFYTLPDCFISKIIKTGQIWEEYLHRVFEKYVTASSIVVECGCHIGTHTLKLASLCEKVYAFEPMPETNRVLNANLILNNIDNVVLFQKSVSDKATRTKFAWVENGNPGGAGLENNPMGTPPWAESIVSNVAVELTTIDSLNLDKLDFMKIDVEGYEPLVIRGAMNTIRKCKPVIVMEIWKDHYGNVNSEYARGLFHELLDSGYRMEHIEGPDFLFLPENP